MWLHSSAAEAYGSITITGGCAGGWLPGFSLFSRSELCGLAPLLAASGNLLVVATRRLHVLPVLGWKDARLLPNDDQMYEIHQPGETVEG